MAKSQNKPSKRIFVLDTNVVIHDPTAIFQFAEHDVVIPITVLEEIDKLKLGEDSRSFDCREFLRNLKKVIEPNNNEDSYSLGNGLGRLTFELWESYPEGFTCKEDINDHRILCIAYNLTLKHKDTGILVTLVTKDVNLRLKARALKVHAEDYTHDMVQAIELESQILRKSDSELKLLKPGEKLLYLNSPIIVHHDFKDDFSEEVSADNEDRIGRWDGEKCNLISRRSIGDTGIKAKNIEQDFAVNILMDPSITASVLGGSAGSGKTLLAVACGIAQKKQGLYDYVLVGRPAIELSDKTIGFQPGDAKQKYKPYLTPIGSACRIIMENGKMSGKSSKANKKNQEHDSDDVVEKWMKEVGIELLPLSMIRGNTFHRAYIIIDEAQNLTPNEIKTIVSRAGEGTKIVFTGDNNQIDVRYLSRESNGPSHLVSRFKGQPYFAYIEMQKSVRSPLAEAADKLL